MDAAGSRWMRLVMESSVSVWFGTVGGVEV